VLAAMTTYAFTSRGFTFAFGLFQNYYETHLLSDTSASNISWIGTLASYLLIVIGVVSGPLFDLGHYKVMLFGGAAMSCFGIFMLSLSTEYYQIILTQGICTGLGCGVLFIPGMALVSRSFHRRRAVALGTISCGAPFGKQCLFLPAEARAHQRAHRWHHLHHQL
jgi:MFS family permease